MHLCVLGIVALVRSDFEVFFVRKKKISLSLHSRSEAPENDRRHSPCPSFYTIHLPFLTSGLRVRSPYAHDDPPSHRTKLSFQWTEIS